ncbi:MAG: glycerol-3-phosphate transporter permease, partial [Sutterella sp.]|nr:glycerol-3-phosphate transporter permease [Sutterella sp.]
MEKRVVFKSRWLPFLLVAPQLAITLIFFFLPAGQAMYQSVLMQDAFGTTTEFVGLHNFELLLQDPNYLNSFKITMLFSVLVAGLGLAISLTLAVCADRVIRGAGAYKTFLILPYAVAPAVAGVLWMFIFNPTLGVLSYVMRQMGFEWDYLVNANQALTLIVIAAVWK